MVVFQQFRLADVNTSNKIGKPKIDITCRQCGITKQFDHNLVWRKFCDSKCYKQFNYDKKNRVSSL